MKEKVNKESLSLLHWTFRKVMRELFLYTNMHCVISSCDSESQNYMQRFPRSSFLYERWRQAIELGSGEPFPRDVDPLEVVICQQHFTGFHGYQEPVIFRNESLNRQIQLGSCRLCLKFDFSEQIATGCGNRVVVEKTVEDLLRTAFGMELSEVDRLKGICKECLEKLAMIERTLKYFSKKKDHWLQMQDLIEGENVQWHGNGDHEIEDVVDIKDQILHETTSPLPNTESNNEEEIKVETEDANYYKVHAEYPDVCQVQDIGENLLEELSVDNHSNIPLVQIPMQTYEAYEENHKRTEQHQCSSCQRILPSKTDYNEHCLEVCKMQFDITNHPQENSSQPQEKIASQTILDLPSQQSQTISGPSHPFVCQACPKSFSSEANLKNHRAIHQSAKIFTCQYCTKQFRTRKAWKIHETVHENAQAYTCEICSKCFTNPSNMKRHQQLHVGAREYGCDTCGKRFTRYTHLAMHQRVHTGEKPYQCPECGSFFSTSSGLAKHRRNVSCNIIPLAVNGKGRRTIARRTSRRVVGSSGK